MAQNKLGCCPKSPWPITMRLRRRQSEPGVRLSASPSSQKTGRIPNPPPSHFHRVCEAMSAIITFQSPILHGFPISNVLDEHGAWLYSRYVPDLVLLLHLRDQVLRQLTHDLGGVHSLHISIQPLPLCHPALARLGERDEAFEDGRGAVVDLFVAAREAEELFAVGTSFSLEALHEKSQYKLHVQFVRRGRGLRRGLLEGDVDVRFAPSRSSRPCMRATGASGLAGHSFATSCPDDKVLSCFAV